MMWLKYNWKCPQIKFKIYTWTSDILAQSIELWSCSPDTDSAELMIKIVTWPRMIDNVKKIDRVKNRKNPTIMEGGPPPFVIDTKRCAPILQKIFAAKVEYSNRVLNKGILDLPLCTDLMRSQMTMTRLHKLPIIQNTPHINNLSLSPFIYKHITELE